ncbi:MAG: hypothetical protein K2M37_07405 [Muribaculaceae bacterium]|nr:hypothetical protein [Muribaculaceae bacterium]
MRIEMAMNRGKRYGVMGYLEWETVVGEGSLRLRIHFSGGGMTAYGVTPAEYSTDNPVVQHLIESSRHYRTGKIFELRQDKN